MEVVSTIHLRVPVLNVHKDMQHFECDYLEGAHPLILERLVATNMEKTPGYTEDEYCEVARRKIRQACGSPDAGVFFLVGGTQTNATVVDALLRPVEGVVAAETGHVALHEAGAIEASGHKVLTLPQWQGKLQARTLRDYLCAFYADESWQHMVAPGMVYLSHPTEYGTLYTRVELEEIAAVCREYHLPLYLDGARLGYGLVAEGTDVTLETLANLCDVFYIGGTKVGALFGEAVVIPRPELMPRFFSIVKQHGALLAKGRLLGIQFDTLFTDGLYFAISRHALEMAGRLRRILEDRGYVFYLPPQTNQLFVVMDRSMAETLSERVGFSVWEQTTGGQIVIRLATSWATRIEDIDALAELL